MKTTVCDVCRKRCGDIKDRLVFFSGESTFDGNSRDWDMEVYDLCDACVAKRYRDVQSRKQCKEGVCDPELTYWKSKVKE